ncbi:MAG: response regulator [Planctomycetota bacterium]
MLLAEDEDGVRTLARRVLQQLGYNVIEAANGTEALQREEEYDGPIDILLTDVIMPDRSGRVLANELRARRPGIKVLYTSGYTDDAIVRSGVLAAKDPFVPKPFTPLTLARRVREAIDRRT